MACGARSGLKRCEYLGLTRTLPGLNGLWSPFGFETFVYTNSHLMPTVGLNGLWSPFGFETIHGAVKHTNLFMAKWPVEPVRV